MRKFKKIMKKIGEITLITVGVFTTYILGCAAYGAVRRKIESRKKSKEDEDHYFDDAFDDYFDESEDGYPEEKSDNIVESPKKENAKDKDSSDRRYTKLT